MNERTEGVFSIARDNPPVKGCTVSKEVKDGENRMMYFSLSENTDISAEIYDCYKLIQIAEGNLTVYGKNGWKQNLQTGEGIVTPADTPVGMKTDTGAVYTEVQVDRDSFINGAIRIGQKFCLNDLVPYQEGKILNMDLIHNDHMKLAVMAFDAGTGLSEHAAPGEALVTILDGNAVIGYEGRTYPIQAGENFRFAKGGRHSLKAEGRFRMSLLLSLAQEKEKG